MSANDTASDSHGNGRSPARRGYGSGSLYQRAGNWYERAGNWYGRWYANGERVKRKLGPVRPPGTREGLTGAQAEREMRRLMAAEEVLPVLAERVTVTQAGERLLSHLEALGRRPTTLRAYGAALRKHLSPALGALPLSRIEPQDVERFIAAERRRGVAPKTMLNALGFLHSIFEFGLRRGWCRRNPCKLVDKPRVEPSADIRFLDREELEALVRPTADATDRTLFLTAALTGMRQGELLALRWRDIDWPACRVRVRRNYVHGTWGAPKTRRGSRAVPRWPTAWRSSSSATSSALRTAPTTTWSSVIRRSARCSTTPTSCGASSVRSTPPACERSASTICAIRSARGWRRPASRCARCRSGSGTATSPPRCSTRTTSRARWRPSSSSAPLVPRGRIGGLFWGPILSEDASSRDHVDRVRMGNLS